MRAEYNMHTIDQILTGQGLNQNGRAQRFHTHNVLRRIIKYMPYQAGSLIKLTINQTNIDIPEIVTEAPQAQFLYRGKLMIGMESRSAYARRGEVKQVTGVNLNYTKTKNPQAGPYWDRALVSYEMPAMVADLQGFIKRG